MNPEEENIPEPIGNFTMKNATPMQMYDGAYYHYADVCVLLKQHHQSKLSELRKKVEGRMIEIQSNYSLSQNEADAVTKLGEIVGLSWVINQLEE